MTVPQQYAPANCDQLGEVTDYTAVVTNLCGSSTVTVAERLTDLSWGRSLDDASGAQVTIPLAGADDSQCEALSEVRSWLHEVHLFRGDMEVWSGPVIRPVWGPNTMVLNCRDNFVWFDRLAVEEKLVRVKTDLAVIAEDLVRGAVDVGNGAGCLVLDVSMTGLLEDRTIELHSGYVGDALRELARAGLSFTCLGRRLVLFGTAPLAVIGPLSDGDVLGDLTVQEDGLDGCSRAVVIGKDGVTGVYERRSAAGRVTKLVKDDTITTVEDANAQAFRLVRGGYPWPVQVMPPGQGAPLAKSAPVCIDQLIPGVAVRTFASDTCRQFVTDLQLTAMQVQLGANTETVQVTLAPPAPHGAEVE